MKKRIGLQGFLVFFAIITALLLSKFIFSRYKGALDEFLDSLGIIVTLFGFLFRIAARGYKAEKSPYGETFIKDGPYRLVRNPMYLGTLLIGIGVVLVLIKLWLSVIFLASYFFIYIPQIKKEEDYLLKKFGEEYKNYCKTVPRYFPSFYHLIDFGSYLSVKLSWVRKELPSLIYTLSVILIIEVWEDIRFSGYREFFKEASELAVIILFFSIIIYFFSAKKKPA